MVYKPPAIVDHLIIPEDYTATVIYIGSFLFHLRIECFGQELNICLYLSLSGFQ
jgi:hypothetical protein